MRLHIILLMFIFASEISIAQVADSNLTNGTINIRLTPEGSYKDSMLIEFSGVWSPGFETNKFNPCGNWIPDSLGGTAFVSNRIGLSNGEAVWSYLFTSQNGISQLSKRKSVDSLSGLFIGAKGWLIGPDSYNHFGQNLYTLKTIRMDSVRWAKTGECEN